MNRKNLLNVYDCINRIAAKHEVKGIDRSNWFYSDSEFSKIKQDNRNTIL